MKKNDKALKAKAFREKIALNPTLELEPQTLDNFKKLFDDFDNAFSKIV